MIELANDHIKVQIKEEGAELVSIQDQKTGFEFLWQGDDSLWSRQAPVLFPIIGSLKDGHYKYQDQIYSMSKHGFARDKRFHTQMVTQEAATFYLKSDSTSLDIYPFEFSLQITYILTGNKLTVSYEVLNPSSDQDLYYNLGSHPAFNVGYNSEGDFSQLEVAFVPKAKYLRLPLHKNGLVNPNKAKYEDLPSSLLRKSLFKADTFIYQIAEKTKLQMIDQTLSSKIILHTSNMNYIALWYPYPKEARFISLEAWAGLPDTIDSNGKIDQKPSIIRLSPQAMNMHSYTLEFYKK